MYIAQDIGRGAWGVSFVFGGRGECEVGGSAIGQEEGFTFFGDFQHTRQDAVTTVEHKLGLVDEGVATVRDAGGLHYGMVGGR